MENYKRKREKQRIRWCDDINEMLQHKLFHKITANRNEWGRLQEAFAQEQGSCK